MNDLNHDDSAVCEAQRKSDVSPQRHISIGVMLSEVIQDDPTQDE